MYEMATFRERTLANRYQPRQHLPPNFPQVLKEYAREVLRAQPDDVLQWSANYFKRLALEADSQRTKPPSPAATTTTTAAAAAAAATHEGEEEENRQREEAAQALVAVFAELDVDKAGVLPVQTVKKALLDTCGLTLSQALYILTSTSLGDNDMINYVAFASKSCRVLRFFQETNHEFNVSSVEDATVHGLNRKDVELEFLRLLRYADEADSGLLSLDMYCKVLMDAPYHLTHRDLRLLRIEAARDENKLVPYESELVFMFDRLLLAEQFVLFDEGC